MSKQPAPGSIEPFGKVAIVHDWLVGGGAEKVVEQLHALFPDAPIYTSYCSPEWRNRLDGMVRTGFLQYWPFPQLRKFVPLLRIWWFSRLDLSAYDLVISSSGAEAKGITVTGNTPHVAYIHAPTHYYWSRYDQYMENPGFGKGLNWLARIGLKLLVRPLRSWDYRAAQKPHALIANSSYTQDGILQYYHRKSTVVFPPVDDKKFSTPANKTKRRGFVISGRQVPYKRIDLAIQACSELGLPLTVIGHGPQHAQLQALAADCITFKGYVSSDQEVAKLLSNAEAFLFPGIDDFGIAPVEAMAAGTPVIAYKAGGALDYIVPGKTGEFFEKQTVDSLKQVLQKFDSNKYSVGDIKRQAQRFSNEQFAVHIIRELEKSLQ